MQEVIPEFKQRVLIKECRDAEVQEIRLLEKKGDGPLSWKGVALEKGFKVISVVSDGECGLCTLEVGLPWSTADFVAEAQRVAHPLDREVKVPPSVAKVIFEAATGGPKAVAERRRATLARYAQMAAQLQTAEEELHSKLHPDVESVVKGKNILLFKQMLRDIRYDDLGCGRPLGDRCQNDRRARATWHLEACA